MALYEDVTYSSKGKMRNNSFLQYKIPTRMDVGKIRVDFESNVKTVGHLGQNPLEKLLLIHHLLHWLLLLHMQVESM